ncbi:DUF2231 domain-containing protein [Fodinibius sp.]|uniref:DUF2231 domain-containing protein n=1 Tax=Fodinibius sp. TaxID=1872440 RepID=UPI002ACD7445|nr:DUF2231 domain-containing protein [Fodinibius sp.]MDZ7659532.1 DUF2231 domain-containing protein [Fodinibius sp.]
MQEPLSMWRVELIHPFVIHIPIALLIVGSVFWIVSLWLHKRYNFLRPSARLLLFIGTIGAWIAVYTGSLADAQVVRSLCDPTVVEQHENLAYIVGYLFTAFVIIEWLSVKNYLTFVSRTYLRFGLVILLIVGCGFLGYVGHLGSTLVYQQSAAVYQPTEGCVEFE